MFNGLHETLKKHVMCIIVLFIIILVSVTTIAFVSKDKGIVDYVSFASSLASIIMAILAIGYGWILNIHSQRNLDDIKDITSRTSFDVQELKDSRDEQNELNEDSNPIQAGEYSFDVTRCHRLNLLLLYAFLKSNSTGKSFSIVELAKRIKHLPYTHGTWRAVSYFRGSWYIQACMWPKEKLRGNPKNITVKNLDQTFIKAVEDDIERRLNLQKSGELKQLLEEGMIIIDNYFDELTGDS